MDTRLGRFLMVMSVLALVVIIVVVVDKMEVFGGDGLEPPAPAGFMFNPEDILILDHPVAKQPGVRIFENIIPLLLAYGGGVHVQDHFCIGFQDLLCFGHRSFGLHADLWRCAVKDFGGQAYLPGQGWRLAVILDDGFAKVLMIDGEPKLRVFPAHRHEEIGPLQGGEGLGALFGGGGGLLGGYEGVLHDSTLFIGNFGQGVSGLPRAEGKKSYNGGGYNVDDVSKFDIHKQIEFLAGVLFLNVFLGLMIAAHFWDSVREAKYKIKTLRKQVDILNERNRDFLDFADSFRQYQFSGLKYPDKQPHGNQEKYFYPKNFWT